MNSLEHPNHVVNYNARSPETRQPTHQRSRSNVLKSFMHRRNNSDGSTLPPADLLRTQPDVPVHNLRYRPMALGELQQNQVDLVPRSASRHHDQPSSPSRPPVRNVFSTISLKSAAAKESESLSREKLKENTSPNKAKPKKIKSTTNLAGLLGRSKSQKDLRKRADEDSELREMKDKENRTPPTSLEVSRPPIYAQFSSGALETVHGRDSSDDVFGRPAEKAVSPGKSSNSFTPKTRPQSYHAQQHAKPADGSAKASPSKTQRGLRIFTKDVGSTTAPQTPDSASEPALDPKDIDKHLEAMLDRRNIPENQRYKMRNLADTIKMEFIRQDWAEKKAMASRPGTHDSDSSLNEGKAQDGSKRKHTRGRSFTLSRNGGGKKSESNSPTKKQRSDGTLGRHFRSRSTDSIASERPSSSGSGASEGILSKIKLQQGPVDYVNYLRKVQKPEAVEVGKLHKLRLLLRNETVAWTEDFIRQGGMEEIVGLLHRIMEVEWREEHEDALLHEVLLCLKALCTIGLALQYLHSIQAALFPALLHMLFDPEKKGPSEFTTRNIITSIIFTYISSAPLADRVTRARTVLDHLRDPEPKEEDRPLGFVLDMRRDRPYRVWCKEAVSVTKEVFWIFLHHLNVVYLPRDMENRKEALFPNPTDVEYNSSDLSYMAAHFPQERPPVPAAPYVGGVEWDATNYLASHLDLLNAIIACTPSRAARNELRGLLRISGWERCLGGSLRLCKEKFYPGVHDGLRTWVAAAADDGWEFRDVRYGPPPESTRSPVRKAAGAGAGGAKKVKDGEVAPQLEMPKLDFMLDVPSHGKP